MNAAQKFAKLKIQVGGNREVMRYEETFGTERAEDVNITPPNKHIRRILGELEFAIRLNDAENGRFDSCVDSALDFLLGAIERDGVLTKDSCREAEELLVPMQSAAKEYKLILAGHAHIDMNWMWSFQETVAATVSTFRTMLRLMNEYPQFHFSQSQASVYKIIDDYAPELKEQIKARIAEGRWEITASAWVETDKNMPSGESLMRHIEYTKNYLQESWGVAPESLQIDFSPDTFGHSANIPEIDLQGGVKYYYHCRGLDGDNALYRWRGQSGAELLCYREQYWYNSGITPKIGAGIIDVSRRSGGLKTGLIVYGVGNHGGGPTRRDIERAIEMQEWRVFPEIRFGTFREFFKEAESVRESLPFVDGELNFIFPGCYTTQSRIKMGNRLAQNALINAEALCALAQYKTGEPAPALTFEKAWRDVLFTHFHDILTGSCVQDSREHAMGLYQTSLATAQTRSAFALEAITDKMDTSALGLELDCNSQSEGAGAGYKTEFNGYIREERGSGKRRAYTVFNPTYVAKHECAEITVWDWRGDMRRLSVTDSDGNAVEFAPVTGSEKYWDHHYFKLIAYVELPAFGYKTLILDEKEMTEYPLYYQPEIRTHHPNENIVLENDNIRAEFDFKNGLLISLKNSDGEEHILKDGAGFRLVDTECDTSNAWCIGNYIKSAPVCDSVKISRYSNSLKSGFKAEYKIKSSVIYADYSLEKGANAVELSTRVDWSEIGGDTIPVLTYEMPLSYSAESYMYDIPAGFLCRKPMQLDVPAQQYALAVKKLKTSVAIMSDCKYGFRGTADNKLSVTLLNSSTSPDEYPERGIHEFRLGIGLFDSSPKVMEDAATSFNNKTQYAPLMPHSGTQPLCGSLCGFETDSVIISSIAGKNGGLLIRMYESVGKKGYARITFDKKLKSAYFTDLFGNRCDGALVTEDNSLTVTVRGHRIASVIAEFYE